MAGEVLRLLPVAEVIPETSIVVICPHFDDFLFTLGNWVIGMGREGLLSRRRFHIVIVFSRSNYLARSGDANHDRSLERQKLATGRRLLEDMGCIDEMLGPYTYTYQLAGELECMIRGKSFGQSDMEFPHGTFEDFDENDRAIFLRLKARIAAWALAEDTAIVMPLAFKEHIDHFIVREAGLAAARELGGLAKASLYFQEDKPYAGIADAAERGRIERWVGEARLDPLLYAADPEMMIDLAFRHYVSQVEPIYREGIRDRARRLMELQGSPTPCDCVYRLPRQGA